MLEVLREPPLIEHRRDPVRHGGAVGVQELPGEDDTMDDPALGGQDDERVPSADGITVQSRK